MIRTEPFIGGAYVQPQPTERFDDMEPATGRILASVANASADTVAAAVSAAREAADHGPWPRMSTEARARILERMADKIEEHGAELAMLEARDVGKPLAECMGHDVPRAARNLRFFAAAATATTQEACVGNAKFLDAELRLVNLTQRAPLGTGAIIIPWNSPLMLATWNLGPGLATGNTCVLKPSELAPLSCLKLGDIAVESGLPPGVLNIVAGEARTGADLVGHPDIDGVAFTGGVATGRQVMAAAAETLKRVALELGGKSPSVVFADADLKRAAAGVTRAIFRSQGQSCVAGSRLLVEERIADGFIELLSHETAKLRIGDPLEEATEFGPLISAAHRDRVEGFVTEALRDGAMLICGGARPIPDREGFYYLPTILDRVNPRGRVVCEEIFGPVLTIQRFSTEDEALALANESRYGLAAYIWTSRVSRALRFAERLKTGMVWLNSFFLRDLRTPFGGSKQSGLGRQGGRYSLEFWTEPKLVCMAYEPEETDG